MNAQARVLEILISQLNAPYLGSGINRIPFQLMAKKDRLESSSEKNSNRLFGFIRNRVKSNEDAEDILQDVWYQLSRLINLDDIENVSGWLFRVARNRIVDLYRKSSEDLIEDQLFLDDGEFDVREILFGEAESISDQLFKDLFWEELMDALEALPIEQREVFVKSELEGMKLREIAEERGESIKTITSRKGYAVKHLRSRLKKLYEEL